MKHEFWVVVPFSPLPPGNYSLHLHFNGNLTRSITGEDITRIDVDASFVSCLWGQGETITNVASVLFIQSCVWGGRKIYKIDRVYVF